MICCRKGHLGKFVMLAVLPLLWLAVGAVIVKKQHFPFVRFEELPAAQFDRPDPGFRHIPLPEYFVAGGYPDPWNEARQQAAAMMEMGDCLEAARVMALFTRERFRNGDAVVLDDWHTAALGRQLLPALCSEYAKFFVVACQNVGLEARVVWMANHTTAEVWCGGKPIIVDPNGNVVLEGEDGEYLGISDLARGASFTAWQLLPADAGGGDDPDFLGTESMHVYEQVPLAVEIEGARLFDFHRRNRSPVVLWDYLTGGQPAAHGRVLADGRQVAVGGGRAAVWLCGLLAVVQLLIGVVAVRRGRKACPSGPSRAGESAENAVR